MFILSPKNGINVGEQLITEFNKLLADCLPFRPKTPRFTVARISCRMDTHKGREYAKLHPTGVQFSVRFAREAANVRATERQTRYGQALQLEKAYTQVFPRSYIIAGPNRRIALRTCIGSPCYCEGSLIALQLFQSVVSRTYHLHTVDVMCLSV